MPISTGLIQEFVILEARSTEDPRLFLGVPISECNHPVWLLADRHFEPQLEPT